MALCGLWQAQREVKCNFSERKEAVVRAGGDEVSPLDMQICAASAVMKTLDGRGEVKRESSVKLRCSISRSMYDPTLTFDLKLQLTINWLR